MRLALPLSGCLGLVIASTTAGCWPFPPEGDADSGNDVAPFLDYGDVAVDAETETTFAVVSREGVESIYDTENTLFAVRAGASTAEVVADLSGHRNLHVGFTTGGVLVLSQPEDGQQLLLLDRDDFQEKARLEVSEWYDDTRLSPSGRWLAFHSYSDDRLRIVDGETLEAHVAPRENERHMKFTHHADRLVAYSIHEETFQARFLAWDMATLEERGFAETEDEVWAGADLDLTLDGVHFQYNGSYTPVISPDDRYLVVPASANEGGTEYVDQLIVLDLESGEPRFVPHTLGPVVFTSDGSTMLTHEVASLDPGEYDQHLVVIDLETLSREVVDVEIDGGFDLYVPRSGNTVLLAQWNAEQNAVLYDLESGTQTEISGVPMQVRELVVGSDPEELWIAQDIYGEHSLLRVDLAQLSVHEVATSFTSEHIGLLRGRDEVVVTDTGRRTLHFLDLDTEEELRTVELQP